MTASAGDAEPDLGTLVRMTRTPMSGPTLVPSPEGQDTLTLPVAEPRKWDRHGVRAEYAAPAATRMTQRGYAVAPYRDPSGSRWLVVALVVASLFCLGGFVYVGANPSWFFPPHAVSLVPAATRPVISEHLVLLSSTTTAVTYQMPVTSYSLLVSCDHPCWVEVRSPAQSGAYVFARTLPASVTPFPIQLTGSSSISVAARVRLIQVMDGPRELTAIASPILSTAYTFVPRGS